MTPVTPFGPRTELQFPPVRQQSSIRRATRLITGSTEKKWPLFYFHVGPRVFTLIWIAALVLHALCALQLGAIGGVYFYSLGTSLVAYMKLYEMIVDPFYLPPIGIAYLLICSAHAFSVMAMVFHTARSQRSAFTSTQFSHRTVTTTAMRIRRMSLTALSSLEFRTESMLYRLPSPFARLLFRIWSAMSAVYTASHFRNECYELVYLVRVALQVALHMHQLYLASVDIPTQWLNHSWITLLVANCWGTVLLTHTARSNRPRTRLLCLLLNILLDGMATIVVPLIILPTYAPLYNPELANFGPTFWYNDRAFIRGVHELRFVFIDSAWDFCSKFLIALNMNRSLRVIPTLLKKVENGVADFATPSNDERVNGDDPAAHSSSMMVMAVAPAQSQLTLTHVRKANRRHPSRRNVFISMVVVVSAAVAIGLHVDAGRWAHPAYCGLALFPWLSTMPMCSFVELRCTNATTLGRAAELDALMGQVDASRIVYVSIRYCPEVEIPGRFKTLHSLLGFKTFNSTIVQWDDNAAITGADHPKLRFLLFAETNFVEFPRGLMSPAFPRGLNDVELSRGNLTSLPLTLDRVWPPGMYLVLEELSMQEIPPVLWQLRPSTLSVAKNHLTEVPDALLETQKLEALILNGNPITTLPPFPRLGPILDWLSIIDTAISELPEAYENVSVRATGTSLCDAMLSGTHSQNATHGRLNCAPRSSPITTIVPIELEELLNG